VAESPVQARRRRRAAPSRRLELGDRRETVDVTTMNTGAVAPLVLER
jgi:hypothetical protein